MIKRNSHKYSVSAMCKVLQIARSTFYYDTKIAAQKEQEKVVEEQVLKEKNLEIFNNNRQVYGTRKIKKGLAKSGFTVSRRRIGRLMDEIGIDELLRKYQIKRSLSDKDNPYDNAVAEATFKILKTELINGRHFQTLEQLALGLFDYVNWYNNIRLYSSLGYLSPVGYRISSLKKIVRFCVDIPTARVSKHKLVELQSTKLYLLKD